MLGAMLMAINKIKISRKLPARARGLNGQRQRRI